MMTTGISLSVAIMTLFIDVNNTKTSSFTYLNNAVTWILNGSFLTIGDDDDGKATECCHHDNYVLCRHELRAAGEKCSGSTSRSRDITCPRTSSSTSNVQLVVTQKQCTSRQHNIHIINSLAV